MAGDRETTGRLAHIPGLDGLRGLAVLAVLCFHGELTGAGGGFLGVSTFFTLSGFLITSLLLLEWERSGRIDLLRFWARRARRLLPAALVALVGIGIYGAFVASGHAAERIGGDGLSALFYVANWRFVIGDQSYAALFSAPSPVQHFWSLAIEEQFYLLFPLLLVGVLPWLRTRRRLATLLVGMAAGSVALAWVLWAPGQDPARVYYGTDTRAVELLVGAWLATRIAGRRRVRVRRRRVTSAAVGGAAFVGLIVLWSTAAQTDTFLYRGGLPLNAVLTAFVIAGCIVPGPLASALSWSPLRRLGIISYGVYLYHWPIFLWLDESRVGTSGLPLFAVRMTVTLALAAASYRWLEAPVRTGARATEWRPRVLAPLGAVAAATVLLVGPGANASPTITFEAAVDRPGAVAAATTEPPQPAALPNTGPVEAAPVEAGPVGAAPTTVRRVMVVGDSVALTLGRGLEVWGQANGVDVLNAGRLYCPIARGGRLAASLGRSADECADWPTVWDRQLTVFQPDVVVVLTTVWDISPRRREEWGPDFVGVGDPRFDEHVTSEWAAAVRLLEGRGARVVWLTPPCTIEPAINDALEYARAHYIDAVADAGATPIDLSERICPDGKLQNSLGGVTEIRPDAMHFSDPGAELIARWLGPQLMNGGAASSATSGGRMRRV